jgi:hypothetical protein
LNTFSPLKRFLRVMAVLAALIIAVGMVPSLRAAAQPPLKSPAVGSLCRPYDPAKEDPPYCATDSRVNPGDAVATMTAYCQQDHSLQVYAIINSNGVFLYTVSAVDIANGLATAQATGQDILIADHSSRQVWALVSGNLLLHDYAGYDFIFRGDICGLVPGTVQPVIARRPSHTRAILNSHTSRAVDTTSTTGATLTSITTGYLNMRSAPDNTAYLFLIVPPHVAIQVVGHEIGSSWNWVKISYHGLTGWVSSRYCGLTNDDLRRLPAMAK